MGRTCRRAQEIVARNKTRRYNMIQEQNSSGFLFVRRIKWRQKSGSMTKYQPLYGDMPSTFIEEFGLELRVWLPPQLVTESWYLWIIFEYLVEIRRQNIPIPFMVFMVFMYLHRFGWNFDGFHVGKYTCPMVAMGYIYIYKNKYILYNLLRVDPATYLNLWWSLMENYGGRICA